MMVANFFISRYSRGIIMLNKYANISICLDNIYLLVEIVSVVIIINVFTCRIKLLT